MTLCQKNLLFLAEASIFHGEDYPFCSISYQFWSLELTLPIVSIKRVEQQLVKIGGCHWRTSEFLGPPLMQLSEKR